MDSTANDVAKGGGLWAKGFGNYGTQDARGDSSGYDSTTYGAMIAYDRSIGFDTRAGLGFGYAESNIDGKKFDSDMDFDTYQVTAYLGHENGPWFIHSSGTFGWNDYTSTRHIVFPGVDKTASADYNGQEYTAFGLAGYHFSGINKFTITPMVSIQYSRVNTDDYTETGAGDTNLIVDSQSYDYIESGLGIKVERDFSYRGGVYVPEGHFKLLHELSNPTSEQTAVYAVAGSPSFTTLGQNTADNIFNVGAGLTLLPFACGSKTWSLEIVWDYNWGNEGYSAHQGTLRVTNRF